MCDESDDDDQLCISTAVVDKAEDIFNFKNHIFVTSTRDGGFSEMVPKISERVLKCWEGHVGDEGELTPDWKDAIKATLKPGTKEDRLHVHCQCNGVSFYISRPDWNSEAFKKDFPNVPIPGPEPRDRQKEYKLNNWFIATNRKKYIANNCVCTSCRLGSGSEVVQWSFVPTCFISQEDGSPFSRLFGTMKEYNSSENTWRRFCGTCGASIMWHDVKDRPYLIDVAVGIMDAESGARAEDWLEWRLSKLSYKEDALNKALAQAVEDGSREWNRENEEKRLQNIV
jgi:hypothetical protein